MNANLIKNTYFEDKANLFKVLGSPVKLKLLQYISFAPRTVEDCANKFSQSIQNISLHLIALKRASILDVRQVKNYRYYYLVDSSLGNLIHDALEFNPKTILPEELISEFTLKELTKRVKAGKLALIDLRDAEESSYLPVAGAITYSGPLSQLPKFLERFPAKSEFVFICKGKMCERLAEAVLLCESKKIKVKAGIFSAKELGAA